MPVLLVSWRTMDGDGVVREMEFDDIEASRLLLLQDRADGCVTPRAYGREQLAQEELDEWLSDMFEESVAGVQVERTYDPDEKGDER